MNSEKPDTTWRLARRPGAPEEENPGVAASRRRAAEHRAMDADMAARARDRRGGLSDAEVAELAGLARGLENSRARALVLLAARELLVIRGTASLLTR